jgi:hypothetical protein
MTTGTVIGILGRRWYVLLVGLLLTAGALHVVDQRAGVYWGHADVVFLIPKSARYPNSIQHTSSATIAVAGLVEREIARDVTFAGTPSLAVDLPGQGVREGESVRLFDEGNQWGHNFSRPLLVIQVAGEDPADVRSRLAGLVDLAEERLISLQVANGTRRSDYITLTSSPARPQVTYVAGRPTFALGMTLVLGAWFTVLGAVLVDRLLERRSRRRAAAARR